MPTLPIPASLGPGLAGTLTQFGKASPRQAAELRRLLLGAETLFGTTAGGFAMAANGGFGSVTSRSLFVSSVDDVARAKQHLDDAYTLVRDARVGQQTLGTALTAWRERAGTILERLSGPAGAATRGTVHGSDELFAGYGGASRGVRLLQDDLRALRAEVNAAAWRLEDALAPATRA